MTITLIVDVWEHRFNNNLMDCIMFADYDNIRIQRKSFDIFSEDFIALSWNKFKNIMKNINEENTVHIIEEKIKKVADNYIVTGIYFIKATEFS